MPTRPPPDLPASIPQPIADYLRRLSLWAFEEIDHRIPKNEMVTYVLMGAYDNKTNPVVYKIQVNTNGQVVANPVPFGGNQNVVAGPLPAGPP